MTDGSEYSYASYLLRAGIPTGRGGLCIWEEIVGEGRKQQKILAYLPLMDEMEDRAIQDAIPDTLD
jgi:hypothetical protein